MELCEGTDSLNQELQAAKAHIARQAEEKEHMQRLSAVQAQQLAQTKAKLDKLEGKAGSYEHISRVVKDQNETLAMELSALHRQVGPAWEMNLTRY